MKVLSAGACLCFFAFAAVRAVRVPLTYDEAAAYLRYIASDVPSVFDTNLLSVFNFEVATNHFLNTLLTRICVVAFGDSELVLRIPNLIGYAMYLGFSFLILHRRTRGPIAFAGIMLLNANPYVLDFFALSRGYGLSLGFLMGTLFFFVRFLEQLQRGGAPCRDLSRALLMACGAVMANFALLNVYVGIFAVSLAALVVFNAVTEAQSTGIGHDQHTLPERRRPVPWLPVVAAVFTFLVFSQDIGLSGALYEPIAVRVVGLNEAELQTVRVSRIDVRGRETRLPRDAGATVWRSDRRTHFRGLRVALPTGAADRIALIEVIVGRRPFVNDPRRGDAWSSHDAGAARVFESGPTLSTPKSRMPAFRPVMNWAGDARYFACVAAYTALALAVWALLAGLLKVVGRLAARANVPTDHQWRPLASSALWLAALAGGPLYILKRESQLYFGGTQGLVQDTFYSVIEGSFYGRTYHAAQIRLVVAGILVTLAAFAIALYVNYRRKTLSVMVPGICLLAIMVIVSLAIVGQHFTFQTPYLVGRTAVFFIPLYVMFVILLCEAIAECAKTGTALAMSFLVAVVSVSMYHFMATANVTHTWDWSHDAGTKAMMEDLGQIVAAERAPGSRVVLGVDWMYSPAAVYYARRNTAAVIDIVVLPSSRGPDFLYVDGRNPVAANAIRGYPIANGVLVRVGTKP
jgi:hypothetical protein